MIEFKVTWTVCPTAYNDPRVFFVTAATREDADKLACNHIERRYGCAWFSIDHIKEVEPLPAGSVKD